METFTEPEPPDEGSIAVLCDYLLEQYGDQKAAEIVTALTLPFKMNFGPVAWDMQRRKDFLRTYQAGVDPVVQWGPSALYNAFGIALDKADNKLAGLIKQVAPRNYHNWMIVVLHTRVNEHRKALAKLQITEALVG